MADEDEYIALCDEDVATVISNCHEALKGSGKKGEKGDHITDLVGCAFVLGNIMATLEGWRLHCKRKGVPPPPLSPPHWHPGR